jgi:hypothetical protein
MGISPNVMEGLIRECKYKSFDGVAYTLGRQTMSLDPKQTNMLFRNLSFNPIGGTAADDEIDTVTSYLNQMEFNPIRDTKFFKMLGFSEVKAIDVNDFESAEIILDLNKEIPDALLGTCDLLVDGSTLDNVFDPVTALRNSVKLLKTNGRLCLVELVNFSHHFTGIPYLIITPMWLYDFFCANNFVDCQMYATIYFPDGPCTFKFNHKFATRQRKGGLVVPIVSEYPVALTVFAEKGKNSSLDRTPSQHAYRSAEEWVVYEKTVKSFADSHRPAHMHNIQPNTQDNVPVGWLYVPPEIITEGIIIVEATYGANCSKGITKGNVTDTISSLCDGKKEVQFEVNVNELGDPAPGLEKDFDLTWHYAEDPKKVLHRQHLSAEAHGKQIKIPRIIK